MRIVYLPAKKNQILLSKASYIVFGEQPRFKLNENQFLILFLEDNKKIMGFMMYEVYNNDTVKILWGGTNPAYSKIYVKNYFTVIKKMAEKFKYIETDIDNKNSSMLRLALRAKFKIVGLRHIDKNTIVTLLRS